MIRTIQRTYLSYRFHRLSTGLLHPASHASAFFAQSFVSSEKRPLPQPLRLSLFMERGEKMSGVGTRKGVNSCGGAHAVIRAC